MSEQPDGPGRSTAYRVAAVSALVLIAVATAFYRGVESWSWIDSFYFSCIAVTTVGFGDLTPSTDAGKLFTVFYIVTGISLVTVVLNERLRRHASHASRMRRSALDDDQ